MDEKEDEGMVEALKRMSMGAANVVRNRLNPVPVAPSTDETLMTKMANRVSEGSQDLGQPAIKIGDKYFKNYTVEELSAEVDRLRAEIERLKAGGT